MKIASNLIEYDETVINSYIADGLDNYFLRGIHPGGFLYAVLTNDLYRAAYKSDFQNIQMMGKIARWLTSNITSTAFGSVEKAQRWINDTNNIRSDYVEKLEKEKFWKILNE